MDIQAIIKQVISLAGLVIKNPSTSIKGSGIDFGSLIGMAGSMLGGKSGSSSNAGGDILGSVLGGLMGGGSNNSGPDTPRSGSNDDGGGLGSILGGLAGMAGMGNAMGNAMGNIFSSNEASNLMSDVSQKEQTINDMLKDKNLNAEQKGNLTDMLGLLKVTERFLG